MLHYEPSPLEVRILTRRFGLTNSQSIDTYLATDGYAGFRKALEMPPERIIEEVKISNLRGRGGAGFPAGLKWGFVPRDSKKPKYIVVNADEGEPGTCKDRVLMEHDPHQLLEGMLIAARAVGAETGYIYIRGEYRYIIDIMDRAIEEAYARGYLGRNILGTGMNFDAYTHTGAGSYECGEESALLESLEGKRGQPRIRPPFPAVSGAFQCPTVLNNVETFCAAPAILRDGGIAFAELGTPRNGGTRLFALSGHINRPGVYELPMGFNLLRMIEEVGGGLRNGKRLKAVVPGGSSCPILKADECDLAMDFDSVAKAGSMLGSGGVIIMDETTDIVKVAVRVMKFYQHESCGWCVPCREGTIWLRKILERLDRGRGQPGDIGLIEEISKNMLGRTFCPLGDAAAMPTISYVQKFREEFEARLPKKVVVEAAPLVVV
jgi:NADH-quinone oxidoreductase subunit F